MKSNAEFICQQQPVPVYVSDRLLTRNIIGDVVILPLRVSEGISGREHRLSGSGLNALRSVSVPIGVKANCLREAS